jgi:hypothetical protein
MLNYFVVSSVEINDEIWILLIAMSIPFTIIKQIERWQGGIRGVNRKLYIWISITKQLHCRVVSGETIAGICGNWVTIQSSRRHIIAIIIHTGAGVDTMIVSTVWVYLYWCQSIWWISSRVNLFNLVKSMWIKFRNFLPSPFCIFHQRFEVSIAMVPARWYGSANGIQTSS